MYPRVSLLNFFNADDFGTKFSQQDSGCILEWSMSIECSLFKNGKQKQEHNKSYEIKKKRKMTEEY